jgi:hypothetical protein
MATDLRLLHGGMRRQPPGDLVEGHPENPRAHPYSYQGQDFVSVEAFQARQLHAANAKRQKPQRQGQSLPEEQDRHDKH